MFKSKERTLGQTIDLLDAKTPDTISNDDVILDVIVLGIVYTEENGEEWFIVTSKGMSPFKVSGLLARAYHDDITLPSIIVTDSGDDDDPDNVGV